MAAWDALYFKAGPVSVGSLLSRPHGIGALIWWRAPDIAGRAIRRKLRSAAMNSKQMYQGYTLQGWFAPDITDDEATGLGRWSPADIVEYLKGGHNRYSAASGPMGEEVMDSSSQWTGADLAGHCGISEGTARARRVSAAAVCGRSCHDCGRGHLLGCLLGLP